MPVLSQILSRRLLAVVVVAAFAGIGLEAGAVASGTASINGPTLVVVGDATRQFVVIEKEPIRDDSGATVGAYLAAYDSRAGGTLTGESPCVPEGRGARCPYGSTTLQVSLAGGDDFFDTHDQTLGKGFSFGSSCQPLQSFAPLRLDGGPGRDIVDGTRLADTMSGGSGNDAIASWDGNDRLNGGSGVDLLEGHDGNDVADGGAGNDVIHLDANPLDRESCFRSSGRPGQDIARGGAGNDAITGSGGDRIEGGAGNDELVGFGRKGGRDTILGGPGRDVIHTRDGRRDYVNCGSGKDQLASSDRSDRAVGCEKRFLRPR